MTKTKFPKAIVDRAVQAMRVKHEANLPTVINALPYPEDWDKVFDRVEARFRAEFEEGHDEPGPPDITD